MNRFIGIIPARYASSRFPGKPLVDIAGKPMIQHVYERASSVLSNVLVATDDKRIASAVESFSGNVVMTSVDHRSGTDRCLEALKKFSLQHEQEFSVVINIQGDEPFIRPEQISQIVQCFDDRSTQIATLIKVIEETSVLSDPNRPKVVVDKNNFALYFSRSPIPYIRNAENKEWLGKHRFYQHIGMYAYRAQVLKEICELETGKLEQAESLEQLRWLENGYRIKTAVTEFESYCIDTQEDLDKLVKLGLV